MSKLCNVITTIILFLGPVAGAENLKLEFGIKSNYVEGVGKINVFTCDDGKVLIELDDNRCDPPGYQSCTKRGSKYIKSSIYRISDSLSELFDGDAGIFYLRTQNGSSTNFEILVSKDGVETVLPATLTSSFTPYPSQFHCGTIN